MSRVASQEPRVLQRCSLLFPLASFRLLSFTTLFKHRFHSASPNSQPPKLPFLFPPYGPRKKTVKKKVRGNRESDPGIQSHNLMFCH